VFKAVLYDWRGTSFFDASDVDWIIASAASIGRQLPVSDAERLADSRTDAVHHPQVIAGRMNADCSVDLHRQAAILELRLVGVDDALAQASTHARDGDPSASWPYPDTPPVLRAQSPGYEDRRCQRYSL
jgi:hypothetical protein